MIKKEAYEQQRIELEPDIKTYIDRLNYALRNGSTRMFFQKERRVDQHRNPTYTNRYTITNLFPNEDEDVYIKIRVELFGPVGEKEIFVMSFHFAEREFEESNFPYKKKGEV